MNSQSISSDSCCWWTPPTVSNHTKILLVALGIIAVGGVIGILGIVGYLPSISIWIGITVCISSILSMVVFELSKGRSDLVNSQSRKIISTLANNTQKPEVLLIHSSNHVNPHSSEYSFVRVQMTHFTTADQSMTALIKCGRIKDAWQLCLNAFFEKKHDTTADPMTTLIEDEQIKEAWQLYLNTSFEESHGYKPEQKIQEALLGQTDWLDLPPEKLLNAIMNHWLSGEENIATKVCPEFIRDCANQYADFRNKCLAEDRLWSCFAGYQEYTADIAKVHPTFGLEVMISKRGADILEDKYRIEIFRSSFTNLLLLIESNGINEDKIKFFANFLLCYQFVLDNEDFEKIKLIRLALIQQRDLFEKGSEGFSNYFLHISLMDLVACKLSIQGIYKGKGSGTFFPPVDMDVASGLFDLHWIEDVTRQISAATDDENIRKGLLYLSLIPQSNPHYIDAQLMLGNIWLDVENFSEAGRYFLYVAKLKNKQSPDALILASMSLLAIVEEEKGLTFVLREDFEFLVKTNKQVRTLNHGECTSLNLEQLIETVERLQKEKNIMASKDFLS